MNRFTIKIKKIINHSLYLLVCFFFKLLRKHKLILLNKPPCLETNAIYAVNHSCKYDIPYAYEAIDKHCYILVGIQQLNFIDKLCFYINGTIWVDRKNKLKKQQCKAKMIAVLENNSNIIMFPEGTWNLHPSMPMLPLHWGIIDIAHNSCRPIVPIILEYIEDCCYVKFADPMYIEKSDDKKQKIDELRDIQTSLRWGIWEQYGKTSRNELLNNFWDKKVTNLLSDYRKYDYEYEQSCIFKPKNIVDYSEVFEHLYSIEPTIKNGFLFNKRIKNV